MLPLVEVVRTELAPPEAVDTAFELAERLGKEPIRCNDTPGFVVNRILIPLLNDCVRVLDEARRHAGGPRQGDDAAASTGRSGRARSST